MKLTGAATVSSATAPAPPGLNITLKKLTAYLSDGSVVGTMSKPLPALTFSGFGNYEDVVCTLNARMTAPTFSGTGLSGNKGGITSTLPAPTMSATGGTFGLQLTLTKPAVKLTGTGPTLGGMSAQLPRLSPSFAGAAATTGGMRASVQALTVQAVGIVATLGALRPTFKALRSSFAGTSATLGNMAITWPTLSAELAGFSRITSGMDMRLPRMSMYATNRPIRVMVQAHVTNTLTNSVTEYVDYNFNSFASFAGLSLAAGPGGLYEVESGNVDEESPLTTPIASLVEFGITDFGAEFQKRISDFYMAMRSDGDITLYVKVDENEPYEYTLSPLDIATLKQRRTLIGKGAKGKYWQFSLANVDGADFDFDTMNVAAVPLSRRL